MSHFIRNGNSWRVADDASLDIHDRLPAGNYVIKQDQFGNLYLEQVEDFEIKGKKYGDSDSNRDRIYNTFMDRSASTGIMLTGEKGSGKTMLAKSLAIKCAEAGNPTILINQPWRGDAFNKLLQDIQQPCMVLFDEFEKVYDSDEQEEMLTLLDGVFPSKKLFVLTCNDKWRVNTHMRNRPGRIFYMLDFKGLDEEFVREYCEDNLKNRDHIDGVVTMAGLFAEFNFDMLKALVEEMNRYNETAQEAMKMLNAKPEFDDGSKYRVTVVPVGGKPVPHDQMEGEDYWEGNPLMQKRNWHFGYDPEPENDDSDYYRMQFSYRDLKKVEAKEGKFVYVNSAGDQMVLTREKETFKYNYYAL
jgi:hypothetical protein